MAFGRGGLASRIVPSQAPFSTDAVAHTFTIHPLYRRLGDNESKAIPDIVMIKMQLETLLKLSAI